MSRSIMNIFLVLLLVIFAINDVTARSISPGSLKHTTKSIVGENGDIIDCVDIHKQPSLQHPLLKQHKVQVPSSETQLSSKNGIEQSWHKSGSCPDGTIPILRSTRNVKSLMDTNEINPSNSVNQTMLDYSAKYINAAVGYVYDTNEGPFYGGEASISIWNLFVEKAEYSKNYVLAADCKGDNSSTIDDMDIANFVSAGWIVDSNTFGDNHPRIYAEWRAGNVGCYNLLCQGFIQVSKNVALGTTFSHVSVYNDPNQFYELGLRIRKDVDNDNWWVDLAGEMVGYWPKEIFSDFKEAGVIVFGGEILNKERNGVHTTTQMGSGHIPSDTEKKGRAGDVKGALVRKFDNNYYNLPLKKFVTTPLCYSYLDNSNVFYYGGPGGVSCDKQ